MTDIRILAVDSTPTKRRIIINALKRAGYSNVLEATDGRDALDQLTVDPVDFLITGWEMCEMDGLALINAVRAPGRFNQLPILLVATRSVQEHVVEALRAGANNFILKPLTPEKIKDKIGQCLAH